MNCREKNNQAAMICDEANRKAEVLRREYHGRFAANAEYRNRVWQILCTDYFSRFIAPDASVLDLGAGWGEFINHIPAAEKYAMDLNPETQSRLKRGIAFIQQDCSESWALEAGSLDVIFTSNFLEHLPTKQHLERTIRECNNALKENGVILCLGPNIKHTGGVYWDFWDHYIPLTEKSLGAVLTLNGFTLEIEIARFLPYSMSTGFNPPLAFLKLYLRLPVVWRFVGRQFLIIGRKINNVTEISSSRIANPDSR